MFKNTRRQAQHNALLLFLSTPLQMAIGWQAPVDTSLETRKKEAHEAWEALKVAV
jgi:hypothetical protein